MLLNSTGITEDSTRFIGAPLIPSHITKIKDFIKEKKFESTEKMFGDKLLIEGPAENPEKLIEKVDFVHFMSDTVGLIPD
jgi:hypothetical protein